MKERYYDCPHIPRSAVADQAGSAWYRETREACGGPRSSRPHRRSWRIWGHDTEGAENDPEAFREIVDCLLRYSEGDLGALDGIELDLEGAPPFFRAAWSACRAIPPGETRSYRWLAAEAGNPLALRAAGQAMARNRFSLIIPCHRVISSDGGLGGYGGGGLGVKAKLLQMELDSTAPKD